MIYKIKVELFEDDESVGNASCSSDSSMNEVIDSLYEMLETIYKKRSEEECL